MRHVKRLIVILEWMRSYGYSESFGSFSVFPCWTRSHLATCYSSRARLFHHSATREGCIRPITQPVFQTSSVDLHLNTQTPLQNKPNPEKMSYFVSLLGVHKSRTNHLKIHASSKLINNFEINKKQKWSDG